MLRYIIIALIAFILVALFVMWVIAGGPRKLVTGAESAVESAVPSEETGGFRLPWQPAQIFPTLDITDALDFTSDDTSLMSAQARLAELETQYDSLTAQVRETRSFGNPSPFIGQVTIVQDAGGVRADSASEEYVQIAANYGNSSTIDIAGWTLESALTGVRVSIPPGASPFIANSANILGPIALDPGGLALVMTAPSPIGVSFRENMCTGYLGQFQNFSPALSEECPSPQSILPLTAENLQQYGDACFDAIANLSSCRFPQNMPNVSGVCRAYLTEFLSYNGCVQANRFRSAFQKNMWRVYLGASGELWRNSHDAIRLLDAQGKTVSVFVY